jgi:hypothetical protein
MPNGCERTRSIGINSASMQIPSVAGLMRFHVRHAHNRPTAMQGSASFSLSRPSALSAEDVGFSGDAQQQLDY